MLFVIGILSVSAVIIGEFGKAYFKPDFQTAHIHPFLRGKYGIRFEGEARLKELNELVAPRTWLPPLRHRTG